MAATIHGLAYVVKQLRATPRGLQTEVWAKRMEDGSILLWASEAGVDTCFQRGTPGRIFVGHWSAERPDRYQLSPGVKESHTNAVKRAVRRIISMGIL